MGIEIFPALNIIKKQMKFFSNKNFFFGFFFTSPEEGIFLD